MSQATFARQPLPQVGRRYDRMARWYRAAEIAILLPHRLRRKAVQRLDIEPGETVFEIGCSTGRNLRLLCDAIGDGGDAGPRSECRLYHLVYLWPECPLCL